MARLYADEDFPFPTVVVLRVLGHEVPTAQEDGKANLSIADSLVLDRSTQLGRAILTKNRRDFIRIHQSGVSHTGIIVCTEDNCFDELAKRIHRSLDSTSSLVGTLIRVNKILG